jgi:hypothetical protein
VIVVVPVARPLTIPEDVPMVATVGVLLVHVPPEGVLLRVVAAPVQILIVPTGTDGSGLTLTVNVATAVPQVLVTEYDIVVTPAAIPVTMPVDAPTVPAAVALLDHAPPDTLLLSVTVDAAQTAEVPVIVPATGDALTVITAFALQPEAVVYVIVVVPVARPLTIPEDVPMVATVGVLLVHVPPEGVLLRVVAVPVQILIVPVGTDGSGLTLTVNVATAVPQALVTEYDIVVIPAAIPVTMPVDAPTVPAAGALLDHTPPDTLLLSVTVDAAQTEEVPVLVPATGEAITVTTPVALQPVLGAV